jgi:hypothetical protein
MPGMRAVPMRYVRPLLLSVGVMAGVLCSSTWTSVAHAQAWVPDQGVLGGDLSYQYDTANKIVEDGGAEKFGGGDTVIQTLSFDFEYVPLEHLAVSASVPLVATRFTGGAVTDGPTLFPHGRWDDGDTHLTLSDLRFDVRYAVMEKILALTPLVGVSIPVGDYETVGLTAPGRGLKQLHLGLAVGRTLEPFLPNLYLHAAYEYSLVEKVDIDADTKAYSQNTSRFATQIGYFIIPDLQINVSFDGLIHHDGMTFVDFGTYPAQVQNYHDVLLKERALLLGGGVAYQLTDTFGLGLAYKQFISGDNTRTPHIIAANLTWEFPVGPTPRASSDDDDDGAQVARAR